MIAVIFEVWTEGASREEYLRLATELKEHLSAVDGFLSIERFESLSEPGKLLSLSFWRDEAAVERWRSFVPHRAAQVRGRAGVFSDYRLRVAAVLRDYGLAERAQAPEDSRRHHEGGAPELSARPG